MTNPLAPYRAIGPLLAAWVALALFAPISAAVPEKPDHTHVNVSVVIARGETSGAGDALGLYALQLVPCDGVAARSEVVRDLVMSAVSGIAERFLGLVVSVAHANHRERFDGPGAAEFGVRVMLDKAQTTEVGILVAPTKRFCSVALVLARLPTTAGRPALPFGLRISSSAEQQSTLDFRQDLRITLDKPWESSGQNSRLTITLRPRRAHAVLQMSGMEDGERMQRIVNRLAADAEATIRPK